MGIGAGSMVDGVPESAIFGIQGAGTILGSCIPLMF